MDTSNIPKTFWHSLSFCMVAGTVGLLVIAYKASSVSIEIANAKIELLSAVSQTKEIKASLEAESKRLASSARTLPQRIDNTQERSAKSSSSAISIKPQIDGLQQTPLAVGDFKYQSEFEALDAKIKSAEEAIKK